MPPHTGVASTPLSDCRRMAVRGCGPGTLPVPDGWQVGLIDLSELCFAIRGLALGVLE